MDAPLDRVLELAQGLGRHAPHVQGQHVCMLHVNSRNAFLRGLLWSPCENINAPQHTRTMYNTPGLAKNNASQTLHGY